VKLQKINTLALAAALMLLFVASLSKAERIKDLAMLEGARTNQLVGFGLIVGLDGSGDQVTQTPFTLQAARSMLQQFGVNVPANSNPQTKNVAAVMVTATLPPFAKPGQTIDVTVSSLGNAKSLRGGELLMTQLKAGNGEVYVVAQGSLIVSGFGAEGADGSSISLNTKSAGRIPNGGIVEREVLTPLHGAGTASALDAVSVRVVAPAEPDAKVAYVAELENIQVQRAAASAKVIVNARSGTIVIGAEVMVKTAAVAHGNLTVSVDESVEVSQPGPFSRVGETVVTTQSEVNIEDENLRMFLLNDGVSLQEIVTAINRVGAAPGDLIAILEALQQAGALCSQLIII
jgi:flagellar P-ring protein precursor FlgI